MEHGARRPGDVPALTLEPHLEAGAGAKAQTFEQLVAESGQSDRFHPTASAEYVDVDERSGRQRQSEWVAAEFGPFADPAAERRERPAERSQRIVGLRKEQAGHPLAGRRDSAPKEVREQTPSLVAAGVVHRGAGPFHPRRAQQMDAQAHVEFPPVTRPVTRPTVTLLLVACKTHVDEREDAHGTEDHQSDVEHDRGAQADRARLASGGRRRRTAHVERGRGRRDHRPAGSSPRRSTRSPATTLS